MHLLSIPSEKKSTSFQMCVYLKKSFVYKSVCVVFIFQTKNTDAAFRPPPPSVPGRLMLRSPPPTIALIRLFNLLFRVWGCFFFFFFLSHNFRWKSEKRGSSTADISVMRAASSSPPSPSTSSGQVQHFHSTFPQL